MMERLKLNKMMIGMVGYPNVGKSSVINVLTMVTSSTHGVTRVAVGATPGKTKHFQTLVLDEQITLCDCPGLVFPTFMQTKADMVCNGILPIDQLRDHISPTALLVSRIPRATLEASYNIKFPTSRTATSTEHYLRLPPPSAREFLQTYAIARGFMAGYHSGPDESRAARVLLKEYVMGKLLYCHAPPDAPNNGLPAFSPKHMVPAWLKAKVAERKKMQERRNTSKKHKQQSKQAYTSDNNYLEANEIVPGRRHVENVLADPVNLRTVAALEAESRKNDADDAYNDLIATSMKVSSDISAITGLGSGLVQKDQATLRELNGLGEVDIEGLADEGALDLEELAIQGGGRLTYIKPGTAGAKTRRYQHFRGKKRNANPYEEAEAERLYAMDRHFTGAHIASGKANKRDKGQYIRQMLSFPKADDGKEK